MKRFTDCQIRTAMLLRRRKARPETSLVFYGLCGGRLSLGFTRPFRETVKALGLNDGINDPRQKVMFHKPFMR